ncbi:ATP-binding protein [Herbiconiux sp. CPCC 205763]|uniref:histidine kinase n=1 Tax=Herbiconiux aconitum TaxID=2970913 RepID=A0ABT2GV88_9MICO|nr:ATP-binding protein [Herbiconiux aconitum]MCS5718801.1 ATP-binding protein [Herbiconiux aconitum]
MVKALTAEDAQTDSGRHEDSLGVDLLACLAHDLRQPISSATAAMYGLVGSDWSTQPNRQELYTVAFESMATMSALVDQLLDLSRIEFGAVGARLAPVALATVVLEAIEELRLGPSDISLDFPPHEVSVLADAALLKRVIVNTLSNAHRYSPAGGRITVRFSDESGTGTLSVIDHGPGIPAQDLHHLFTRFWRSDSATLPGSGLGSYLSRRFVEMMGGAIDAFETHGGGLTVRIVLGSASRHPTGRALCTAPFVRPTD